MKTYLFVFVAATLLLVIGCYKLKDASEDEAFISVSAKNFKSEIDKNDPNSVVLDIRTPQEFQSGYIKGAVNIDFYSNDFKSELNALDKTKTYLIYCRSGNRTRQTLSMMKELGFKKVINLANGIKDWQGNSFDIEK